MRSRRPRPKNATFNTSFPRFESNFFATSGFPVATLFEALRTRECLSFLHFKKSARAFVQNAPILVEVRRVGPLRKEACQIPAEVLRSWSEVQCAQPSAKGTGEVGFLEARGIRALRHYSRSPIRDPSESTSRAAKRRVKSGLPSARTPSPILP